MSWRTTPTSDAQAATAQARSAATRSGARQSVGPLYERAQQTEREAEQRRRAGNVPESVRAYWKAQAFYAEAGNTAELLAQRATREKPSSPAPPPVSPPAAPGSDPVTTARVPEAGHPAPRNTMAPPITSLSTPAVPETRAPSPPPSSSAGRSAAGGANAAPPAAAPPNAALAEESSIRGVLDAYKAAYESMDANAVHRVQPSLSADQLAMLQKTFGDYRSYSVEIGDVNITLAGTRATVACRVTRRFDPKAGRAAGNTVPTVFHLSKDGGSWVITRVEAR